MNHQTLTTTDNQHWKVTDKRTGFIYEGIPKEIVLDMSRQDFIVSCKTDYMLEVQDRVWELLGEQLIITPGEFASFLRQLEKLGFIDILIN